MILDQKSIHPHSEVVCWSSSKYLKITSADFEAKLRPEFEHHINGPAWLPHLWILAQANCDKTSFKLDLMNSWIDMSTLYPWELSLIHVYYIFSSTRSTKHCNVRLHTELCSQHCCGTLHDRPTLNLTAWSLAVEGHVFTVTKVQKSKTCIVYLHLSILTCEASNPPFKWLSPAVTPHAFAALSCSSLYHFSCKQTEVGRST